MYFYKLHRRIVEYFQYLGSTLVRELVGTESTIEGITKLKVGVYISEWSQDDDKLWFH